MPMIVLLVTFTIMLWDSLFFCVYIRSPGIARYIFQKRFEKFLIGLTEEISCANANAKTASSFFILETVGNFFIYGKQALPS